MIHLFVYGTLKRGQRNANLLADQQFVQCAVTEPHYRLYDCGPYPALIDCPEEGVAVEGEVFLIDESTRRLIDHLEEAPRLYQLKEVRLRDYTKTTWTYIYQKEVSTFADSGPCWPPQREHI